MNESIEQRPDDARLLQLAPELLLKIINHLPIQSILRLAASCHSLHEIARSDVSAKSLLKAICPPSFQINDSTQSYQDQLRFLIPHSQLGWFISSLPHRSRLVYIDVYYAPTPANADAKILTLRVRQLQARNLSEPRQPESTLPLTILSRPLPQRIDIPFGCTLEMNQASYIVPESGPGSYQPDAGLSVDILAPEFYFLPILETTESAGSRLFSTLSRIPGSPNADPTVMQITIDKITKKLANLDESENDTLSEMDRRVRDRDNLFSLFVGRTPKRAFPTKTMLGNWAREAFYPGCIDATPDWTKERGVKGAVLRGEGGDEIEGFQFKFIRKTVLREGMVQRPFLGIEGESSLMPGSFIRGGRALENGGYVFQLESAGDAAPLTMGRALDEAEEETFGAEEIKTEQEQFFPFLAQIDKIGSTPLTDRAGEILLSSILGLWVGTYGTHGLEFMNLSVKFVPILEDSALGDIAVVLNPPSPSIATLPTTPADEMMDAAKEEAKTLPVGRYQKLLQCVKITGDINVPAGEVSWIAQLGEIDIESSSLPPSSFYGTIPTISNTTLLLRAQDGPDSPIRPEAGVPGVGRIALSGFVQPSWTESTLTFIRSSHEVAGEGEEGEEAKMVDCCEEIRLRWPQLGKVGNFRRVRF